MYVLRCFFFFPPSKLNGLPPRREHHAHIEPDQRQEERGSMLGVDHRFFLCACSSSFATNASCLPSRPTLQVAACKFCTTGENVHVQLLTTASLVELLQLSGLACGIVHHECSCSTRADSVYGSHGDHVYTTAALSTLHRPAVGWRLRICCLHSGTLQRTLASFCLVCVHPDFFVCAPMRRCDSIQPPTVPGKR